MSRYAGLFISSCLIVCVAACGEVVDATDGGSGADARVNDASTGPDAMAGPCDGPSIALDDLIGCLIQIQCDYLVTCEGFSGTVQECIDTLGPQVEGDLRRMTDAINAGRMAYDGAQAFECLQGFAAGIDTCMQLGDSEACDNTFNGLVGPGGTCFDNDECQVDGSRCDDPGCGDVQCCAANCVSPTALGGDCTNSFCGPDDHCVSEAGGTRTCQSGQSGSFCMNHFDCDDDHYCGSAGACLSDKSDGQACTADEECLRPSRCNGDDLQVGSGTCAKANAAGDACDDYCYGDFYCRTANPGVDSGLCTQQPAIGEECDYNGAYCRDAYCDTTQPVAVCTALGGGGEACDAIKRCNNDHFCNSNGICQSRGGDGAACSNGSECQQQLFCTTEIDGGNNGTCAVPLANGLTCAYDEHCESRECVDDPNVMGAKICEGYMVCQ